MHRWLLMLTFLYGIHSSSVFAQASQPTNGLPGARDESSVSSGKTAAFRVILTPLQHTVIRSKVSSKVSHISKELGEPFQLNEALIQLDDLLFVAEKNKAVAILEKMQTTLTAKQELFRANISSQSELKEAEAAVVSADRDVIFAIDMLNNCRIMAPYTGAVVNINIEEFEIVQAGDILLEIVDDHILIAKFLLPSLYFKQIQKGQKLAITIRETNTTEEATITQIDAVIDPSSSVFKVYAQIPNTAHHLVAGMQGQVLLPEIALNESETNSKIPFLSLR